MINIVHRTEQNFKSLKNTNAILTNQSRTFFTQLNCKNQKKPAPTKPLVTKKRVPEKMYYKKQS